MKVDIISTRRVFDSFFKVDEATVRFERFDGGMSEAVTRLSVERGDSVAAILVNVATERLILVSQFKYPTYAKGPGWLTEVMAGTINPDEPAEDALVRETMEETGYRIRHSEPIGTFYVTPGGSSERVMMWYAEVHDDDRVGKGGGVAGEHEDIRLVEFPLSDIDTLIDSGQIADAKTLVGLMWLQRRRHRGERPSPTEL